jgi:hypothetical protein
MPINERGGRLSYVSRCAGCSFEDFRSTKTRPSKYGNPENPAESRYGRRVPRRRGRPSAARYLATLTGADNEAVLRWVVLIVALWLDPVAVWFALSAIEGQCKARAGLANGRKRGSRVLSFLAAKRHQPPNLDRNSGHSVNWRNPG